MECHASQILLQLINIIRVLFPRSIVLSLRRVFDREDFNETLSTILVFHIFIYIHIQWDTSKLVTSLFFWQELI